MFLKYFSDVISFSKGGTYVRGETCPASCVKAREFVGHTVLLPKIIVTFMGSNLYSSKKLNPNTSNVVNVCLIWSSLKSMASLGMWS